MSLKKYQSYKDSGVEWLGKVPLHWKTIKSKRVYREVIDLSTTGKENLLSVSEYYGVKKRTAVMEDDDFISRAESLIGYKKCKNNDLVINIMLAWKRGLGISEFNGIVSPAYCVFRPTDKNSINPKYFHYLLRTDLYTGYFKSHSTGIISSRLRLYPNVFGSIEILLPAISEQNTIAAFLDRETTKIDTLITEKQRLIELLKEKRQAVISHAVTKGLDPNAPMKDSGVEWLREVPEHWNVQKLKTVLREPLQYGANESAELDNPILPRFIRITDIDNQRTLSESTFKSLPAELAAPYLLTEGDILFARSGATVGKTFVYSKKIGKACFAGYLIRARLLHDVCSYMWLSYFVQSKEYWNYVNGSQLQATIQNVSAEKYANLFLTIPSINEQTAITTFLDRETTKIDSLIAETNKAISLLKERRSSLISAAVTGKIDVRHLAPQEAL